MMYLNVPTHDGYAVITADGRINWFVDYTTASTFYNLQSTGNASPPCPVRITVAV